MNRHTFTSTTAGLQPNSIPTQVEISSGTLEAMKWAALVLMTVDHVNKYLFNHSVPAMYSFGRLAMPLFVMVFAYNLARPGATANGTAWRSAKHLAIIGTVASFPFIALGKLLGWWPLNIMFTLMVSAVVIGLLQENTRKASRLAIIVFVLGGAMVEFWWFALALAVTSWRYFQQPDATRLLSLTAALLALWLANQEPWAIVALPLVLLAPYIQLRLPRLRSVFYLYYPTHLALLYTITIW